MPRKNYYGEPDIGLRLLRNILAHTHQFSPKSYIPHFQIRVNCGCVERVAKQSVIAGGATPADYTSRICLLKAIACSFFVIGNANSRCPRLSLYTGSSSRLSIRMFSYNSANLIKIFYIYTSANHFQRAPTFRRLYHTYTSLLP